MNTRASYQGGGIGFFIGGLLPGNFSLMHALIGALGVAIAAYHIDEPFRRPERKTVGADQPSLMLLQLDGSPHPWLEERGPGMTLLLAIDDATGTAPYALFQEQEDIKGYRTLLSWDKHLSVTSGQSGSGCSAASQQSR